MQNIYPFTPLFKSNGNFFCDFQMYYLHSMNRLQILHAAWWGVSQVLRWISQVYQSLSTIGEHSRLIRFEKCAVEMVSHRRTWWRHQTETFSALLAICAGNSPIPGEFPTQRPMTRSFDVYFDLRPNKRLSKQRRGWWLETQSCPLWRHRNKIRGYEYCSTGLFACVIVRLQMTRMTF